MATDDLDRRLDLATRAARAGARLAMPRYRDRDTLQIIAKGAQDRVTEVDRMVEEAIRHEIAAAFPGEPVLGEELGSDAADPATGGTWVVDPIDGTDCFVFGLPMWSISIAWVGDGEVRAGVIYDPVHDEMFGATLGGGASLNGAPMRATAASTLAEGLVGIGHSSRVAPGTTLEAMERLLNGGGMFHRCGSGALSLAWVAAGRLLGYYEPHINSWDCLSGLLLVREAGGWHNDFLAGEGLMLGNPVLASGPNLVDAMRTVAGE